MNIFLKDVDGSNYEAVCDLEVFEEQEEYVACNMWSLVESHYNKGHTCKAIYQDDTPVGFLMWVQESPEQVSIWRFMVDKNYQKAGIGSVALKIALEEIVRTPNLKIIEICYNPLNPVAKGFYSRYGFQEVGMDEEDEDMLAQILL